MSRTLKSWLNLVFLVITLIINGLGAYGLINGMSQKEVSDKYITLITPSSFTFSIWTLIYVLLFASVIAMIALKGKDYYEGAIDRISVHFWVSCLLNMAWIVAFSYEQLEISVILILAFLITMTMICTRLIPIHQNKRWLLPLTFGIYAGWLFIASVVNISSMLVKWNWDGFGIADEMWTNIILIVAVVLVFLVNLRLRNAAFPLPIAWAYFGITQFLGSPDSVKAGWDSAGPNSQALPIILWAGMGVLILLAIVQYLWNRLRIVPAEGTEIRSRKAKRARNAGETTSRSENRGRKKGS